MEEGVEFLPDLIRGEGETPLEPKYSWQEFKKLDKGLDL